MMTEGLQGKTLVLLFHTPDLYTGTVRDQVSVTEVKLVTKK